MYTIQSNTDTGPVVIQTDQYTYAEWVADNMALDFGEAAIYADDSAYRSDPVKVVNLSDI